MLAQLQQPVGEGNAGAYVLKGSIFKMQSVSWGLSPLFFLMSAEMPVLTLDMILILNAEAALWTLCVCVHFQLPQTMLEFEHSEAPITSSSFLSSASFKEKAGVCVSVPGSLWRVDGGTGFSGWCMFAAERLENPHNPPVLSSPAPPGEKYKNPRASLNFDLSCGEGKQGRKTNSSTRGSELSQWWVQSGW